MSNIMILGAAGFIGTNLALELCKDSGNRLFLVDENMDFFHTHPLWRCEKITFCEINYLSFNQIAEIVDGIDIVYHLISTNNPSSSNKAIENDISQNVMITTYILEACVKARVKKIIFMSSGGAIYGKNVKCPIKENDEKNPITTYGIQKLTIENLLYLYNYLYGLDYVIIRLSNPYGPYQRPNGKLGVISTFVYQALKNEELQVYGDGTVVRDYIYIDDAISAILKVANSDNVNNVYNIGSGIGTSIKEIINLIYKYVNPNIKVQYSEGRVVDVPVNYLDIARYESEFGKLTCCSLQEGIIKTIKYMKGNLW